jgi:solute carrier family 39 (zinc transporter), member 1/2/3
MFVPGSRAIFLRDEVTEGGNDTMVSPDETDPCGSEPVDLSYMPLRIGSIFIILAAALLGVFAPIVMHSIQKKQMRVSRNLFFGFKYFGTGIILGTAWMHLLSPAIEALHNECLQPRLGDYDWAFAIAMMTILVMFFVEMLAARHETFGHNHAIDTENRQAALHDKSSAEPAMSGRIKDMDISGTDGQDSDAVGGQKISQSACSGDAPPAQRSRLTSDLSYPPGGEDHLGHGRDHVDGDSHAKFAGQLTAIFILEFGVVFHSIFIGLVLATSGNIFVLLPVLVFHQLFEGLGLGARLAVAKWPAKGGWWPYLLGFLYALSTPLAIAVGLAARPSNASDQILVNGLFDSISGGILIYTALVELLAHEFMFNPEMRAARLSTQLYAYVFVAAGAAIMAVLAVWA